MPALLYDLSNGNIKYIEANALKALGNLNPGESVFYIDGELHSELIIEIYISLNDGVGSKFEIRDGNLIRDDQIVELQNQNFLNRAREFYQQLPTAITFFANASNNWDSMSASQKQTWLINNFDTVLLAEAQQLRFLRWFIKNTIKRYEDQSTLILLD